MTNATNRVLWVILGFLLTAVGVFGILANRGVIPNLDPDSFLVGPALLTFWAGLDTWGTILVIAAGVVLVALGGWLLRAQLHRRGAAPLPDLALRDINTRTSGTTIVRSKALTHGFEGDLHRIPYVVETQVALTGDSPTPTIWLRLDVAPQADLSVIRDHVDAALKRFNVTSGLSPTRVDVTARVGAGGPAARVH